MNRSMKTLALAALALSSTIAGSTALANTYVNDNLNAADMAFQEGMDGCMSVTGAILVANNPDIYGPTSSSTKEELRSYAKRCGLRF